MKSATFIKKPEQISNAHKQTEENRRLHAGELYTNDLYQYFECHTHKKITERLKIHPHGKSMYVMDGANQMIYIQKEEGVQKALRYRELAGKINNDIKYSYSIDVPSNKRQKQQTQPNMTGETTDLNELLTHFLNKKDTSFPTYVQTVKDPKLLQECLDNCLAMMFKMEFTANMAEAARILTTKIISLRNAQELSEDATSAYRRFCLYAQKNPLVIHPMSEQQPSVPQNTRKI